MHYRPIGAFASCIHGRVILEKFRIIICVGTDGVMCTEKIEMIQ